FPAVARIAAGRTVHPHWGPYLGMSEPRFAFVHPDLTRATAQSAPPIAPAPGQFGPQAQPGDPGQPGQPGHPLPSGSQPQPGSPPQPGSQPQPGPQPQPGSQPQHPASGSNPPAVGQPGSAGPGAQQPSGLPGAEAYSAPVGPQAHPTDQQAQPTPTGQQAYAFSQGTPGPQQYASAPGADATQPYGGPVKPFDRKKATLVTVVAGGAVLLLVAALIVVNQVNGRMFGPEATVEKYFAELSDGDAEGALKVADVDVPQEARALLTNDVLSASKALPDDVTVDEAEVSGDTATVAVTYDVGGAKGNSTLTLHKAGKKALFFDDWALQTPELLTLAV